MAEIKAFEVAGGPGRLANRRGVEAKQEVEEVLRLHGYQVARRVPVGESIYGTQLYADLVIENASH